MYVPSSSLFVLYSRPFLDRYDQCYKNIITLNVLPNGPLRAFVRRAHFPCLSQFKEPLCEERCGFALKKFGYNGEHWMTVNDVPDLFSFLVLHGYKIDTSLTKMMNTSDVRFHTENANKIICFVTYEGKVHR